MTSQTATAQPPVETQAEFDARMARGRLKRATRPAPERDPFKRLPVLDESPM